MTPYFGRQSNEPGEGLAAAVFFALVLTAAIVLAVWGISVAMIVFDDYKDSSDSTYLLIGSMLLFLSASLVFFLWLTGVPQRLSVAQMAVALAISTAIVLAGAGLLLSWDGGAPPRSAPSVPMMAPPDHQGPACRRSCSPPPRRRPRAAPATPSIVVSPVVSPR